MCAKYKYYEQLTKLLLIKFETVAYDMKNNIKFDLYGCKIFTKSKRSNKL